MASASGKKSGSMSRSQLMGIGAASPAWRIAQDVAAEASARCCAQDERQRRLLNSLYRQSTVESRGSVLLKERGSGAASSVIDWFYRPAEADAHGPTTAARMAEYRKAAPGLAVAACAAALADSGVAASAITHVVTVSCTGFAAPGVEAQLIGELGLPRDVGRTQIGFMGCHGALNGLQVADAFARSCEGARVLVCCVELCSLHFQYGWNNEQLVSNALFADGAAAMVVGSAAGDDDEGVDDSDDNAAAWRVAGTASSLMPDSADLMSWHVGDHGFVMSLSPRVPELLRAAVGPWVTGWLAERGMTIADVASWAIHPGGPRILAAVQASLGLADSELAISREVLRQCGNMSSATLLFILKRLREGGARRPCVAMSFGPGLVSEAALLV